MKEPNRIPLDPSTPKAKDTIRIPMPKIYPESLTDDVYIKPDSDSIYTPLVIKSDEYKDYKNSN